MGCCASVERDDSAKIHNDKIDEQLRMARENEKNEVKLLLLGAGESGKSTILKQMRLINEGDFKREERESYKEAIFSNTIQSILVILEAMRGLGIDLGDTRNQVYVETIMRCETQVDYSVIPLELSRAIKVVWNDRGVQEAFKRSNEYQLNDSASYYLDHVERIGASNYIPTNQDVLYSRVKTTGITETQFIIGNLVYKMFDVGGQRSERKKWIHCFEGVTAIIFLVALSEYDQVLIEDDSVNRMQEALTLFDSICNSRWFERTSTILFLNKTDLFKQKLSKSSIKHYFPDYSDDLEDYDAACEFFRQMFESLNSYETKQVYTHYTCATETEQVKFVMSAVNDIIIQENLRSNGLI